MKKRLPNNFGSIVKLSGNRRRPFVVKATTLDENGKKKYICIDYTKTYEEALISLSKYNKSPWNLDSLQITLEDLYIMYCEDVLINENKSMKKSTHQAFNYCFKYRNFIYKKLRTHEMLDCINSCDKSFSTKQNIRMLFVHLDKYAYQNDLIDKMYSSMITLKNKSPTKERVPFTEEEIKKLWTMLDVPFVDSVLIFIYTGFRINELLKIKKEQVNLTDGYIKSGIKTKAGKDRIVPIHHKIFPLVKNIYDKDDYYFLKIDETTYRIHWQNIMNILGIKKNTPRSQTHF